LLQRLQLQRKFSAHTWVKVPTASLIDWKEDYQHDLRISSPGTMGFELNG
jgi:hypothetical protein